MQPGRYVAQDLTLKNILRRAYGSTGRRRAEHRRSICSTSRSPEARSGSLRKSGTSSPTTKEPTPPPQMRLMVQRMLADRFQLKAHWEKRELPVYVLSDGTGGRKAGFRHDAGV